MLHNNLHNLTMKKIILSIALLAMATTIYAQEATLKSKKLEHQVGVQVNELIRQVFNFTNTGTTNNNPYLVTYSVYLAKSGWGLHVGGGYTIRSFANDNGVNSTQTNIDDLNLRLGIEKKFQLAERWTAGVGIDGLYDNDNNKTESTVRGIDTTITKTKSLITSYGAGPMAWLRFNITDKILIGTEASYYYRTGFQKEQVDITRYSQFTNGKSATMSSSKIDNDLKSGNFNVPVAFYISIKF